MRLSREFGTTALVTYGGMALSLCSAPLLARALGADGRGALAASFAAIQTVEFAVFIGLPRGLALERVRSAAVSRTGVLVLLGLSFAATVALYAVAPRLSMDDRVVGGAQWNAIAFALVGLSQLGGQVLLLAGRLVAYNAYRAWPLILPSLVVLVTYPLGWLSFPVAFWSMLVSSVISNLIGVYFAWRLLTGAYTHVRVPWRASLRYWAPAAADNIGKRVDLLVGAAWLSTSQLGVYAVATTLAAAAGGVAQALNLSSLAKFVGPPSGPATEDGVHVRRLLLISTASCFAVTVSAFALGGRVLGAGYEGLGAVTAVLCAAQIAKDCFAWFIDTRTASSGHGRAFLVISVLALVVLGCSTLALHLADLLNPGTLGLCVAAFACFRLLLWARHVITQRSTAQAVGDV